MRPQLGSMEATLKECASTLGSKLHACAYRLRVCIVAFSVRHSVGLIRRRCFSLTELPCVLRVSTFVLGAAAPPSNCRLLCDEGQQKYASPFQVASRAVSTWGVSVGRAQGSS